MDLQARKEYFIQEFLRLQNEEIISQFESLLKISRKKAKEQELQPMSIEQFHGEIEQSMDDSRNGRKIELNDLLNNIKEWR